MLASQPAWASGTVGLWPDVSAPPSVAAEPSKDAALVIGIERYDALPKVVGAADMARDWERYFLLGRHLGPERVRLLTDQNATSETIVAETKALASRLEPGGRLFVVFIGHGAPGGLLVGADARPSEASLAARSFGYRRLSEAASHARTVFILDACFSGIGSDGKTLLPSVQPVIAAKLVADSSNSVISAGEAGEYAGALPGSQRPALSYLLLGALRGWGDLDGDGRVTLAEAHAYASTVLRAMPNSHEQHPQLSSSTPDEVLEKDVHEKGPDLAVLRTKLDEWRPPADSALPAVLRVAVGCDSSSSLGTSDGLAVFIDRAPVASVGRGIFPIGLGKHHVRIRAPGCTDGEIDVDVKDANGADIRGALESSAGFFATGAAGNPDWGRIGVSLWHTSSLHSYPIGVGYSPVATGVLVQPALVGRWWLFGLDLGIGSGPASAHTGPDGTTTWEKIGLRGGGRLPLRFAAVLGGIGVGYDHHVVSGLPAGVTWDANRSPIHDPYLSLWTAVDVYVHCDWALNAGLHADASVLIGPLGDTKVTALGFTIGGAYQPNSVCRTSGSTAFGLR